MQVGTLGRIGLTPGELQMFEMKNLLIRKVGGSMLLEAQKKKVKRQAPLGSTFSICKESANIDYKSI